MITFFTIPRPFNELYGELQDRAIKSWLKISSNIILCGDEAGVGEYAIENNLTHIPNILHTTGKKTGFLHYYWGDICKKSSIVCKTEYLARINTDCILLGDIDKCISSCEKLGDFMLVSQRHDSSMLVLHPPCGIDLHVAKKEAFNNVPQFLVGFGGEDNWLAKQYYKKKTLVDITDSIYLLHQDHHKEFIRSYDCDTDYEYRYNQNLFMSLGGGVNVDNSQYTLNNYILEERLI